MHQYLAFNIHTTLVYNGGDTLHTIAADISLDIAVSQNALSAKMPLKNQTIKTPGLFQVIKRIFVKI